MRRHRMSVEDLISYVAGELDGPRAIEVAAHLETCSDCASSVTRFRAVQQVLGESRMVAVPEATLDRAKGLFARFGPAPAQTAAPLVERLKQVVAELVFDSRRGYALAGHRGAASGYQLSYESTEADVDVRIEPLADESPDRWQMLGQIDVLHMDHEEAGDMASISVSLVPSGADHPTTTVEADEHGFFSLVTEPGHFDLRLHLRERLLVLPDLEAG